MSKENNLVQRSIHDKDNPYAMINRNSLQDIKLSLEATGLLSLLLSNSSGWKIYKDEIYKRKTNGRDATRTAFNELIKNKYILAVQLYKNNLKNGIKYFLYETPYEDEQEELKKCLRYADIPRAESQNAEKPTLISNKEINNNKINNKKESKPKKTDPTESKDSLASDEAHVLSKYFYEKIKRLDKKFKEPNFKTWNKDFDKILKERCFDEIKKIIDNVSNDNFWSSNILCPKKLKSQFTKLTLHFKNKKEKEIFSFNKGLAYVLHRGLIKQKRKEEGMMEIQPDSIFNRENQEYYYFNTAPTEFIKLINKAFNVKFSLTDHEIKKYG